MSQDDTKLMYQPFSSIINPGFWRQLTDIKLNKLKLSQAPINLYGSYSCNLSDSLPCLASFDHSSFTENFEFGNRATCPIYGELTCTNIRQEFLDYNKKEFLDGYGYEIWNAIRDGKALSNPERSLSRCGLLVYADLKKHKFFYWFAFPAVNYPRDVYLDHQEIQKDCEELHPIRKYQPISEVFSEKVLKTLQTEYDKTKSQRNFQRGFFIVKHYYNSTTKSDEIMIYPLTQYNEAIQHQDNHENFNIYFAYSDPSASELYPGWPLRNFLALIAVQFKIGHVKLIRIRKGQPRADSRLDIHHSLVFQVVYELESEKALPEKPLITGWEKNESQQVAPKSVNLSSLLDPKKLAEDAVNLNLRLMKWRLLPSLDLDKIAATKCLLLGCGTLGCHIARGLLAWGIKNISIVDNAKISYSNPVRQTLYTFEDCIKSNGAYKAEVAAASLKKIHPSANIKDYVLSIPMPGHHIDDKEIEQTRRDVSLLETLIESNDAIFLLMDTRESRWLPTLIAMSKQKLVINAAIGFDTFLLQRYGVRNYANEEGDQVPEQKPSVSQARLDDGDGQEQNVVDHEAKQLASDKLGCYFCNDIVAPGDSTIDRTLDQQCTVSRPGVSMMVSAMAVELLVSIMSSRLGAHTPAPLDVQNDSAELYDESGSELGIVPHSIRGNLARYHVYMPTSPYFNKCSACSPAVVNAYSVEGYEFLQRVFDDPGYLEDIAGLKDLQNVSDNVWALDSDEEVSEAELIAK